VREWVNIAAYVAVFGVASCAVYFAFGGRIGSGCDEKIAFAEVRKAVSYNLVSPASAVFPEWSEISEEVSDACIFRISGYVDSQNTSANHAGIGSVVGAASTACAPNMNAAPLCFGKRLIRHSL